MGGVFFLSPRLLRTAARTAPQKGPNDPATRAVQRKLIAGWLDLRHADAVDALRANPGAATVAACTPHRGGAGHAPLHLPMEHVIGYACAEVRP